MKPPLREPSRTEWEPMRAPASVPVETTATDALVRAPVGVAFVDASLRWVAVNALGRKLLGDCNGAWVGRSVRDSHPELMAALEPVLRAVLDLDASPAPVSAEVHTRDGRRAPLAISCFPAPSSRPGERAVGLVLTSVTEGARDAGHVSPIRHVPERRRPDARRQLTELRLKLALAAAQVGTLQLELTSGAETRDGALNGLLGLPAVEAVFPSGDLLSRVHADDRQRLGQAFTRAVGLRAELDETVRILRPDGSVRWARLLCQALEDPGGRATQLVGAMVDLTEGRAAQEERDVLAAVVENAHDLVALISLEGQALFLNESGRRVLGLTARLDDSGLQAAELFPQPERSRFEHEALPQARRDGHWEATTRLRQVNGGAELPVAASLFLIRESATLQPRCLAMMARDISAQERELAEAKKRADFEQQLIGIVSHDLRDPLSVMAGGAALLLRDDRLDERTQRTARRIRSAADRAHRLVKDLLDFTRVGLGGGISVEPSPLELGELAQGVVEGMLVASPSRSIQLVLRGDTHGEWDPDRIAQVLANLVGNALQYSPPETAVRVECVGEEDAVRLAVINQGPPIPPQDLGRLFEPFQRGLGARSNLHRSVGLGLFITRQIVQAHRGEVQVESDPGEGTRFTVRLPRHPQPGLLRAGE